MSDKKYSSSSKHNHESKHLNNQTVNIDSQELILPSIKYPRPITNEYECKPNIPNDVTSKRCASVASNPLKAVSPYDNIN